jgi:carboxypeptidase C (cathepsin A)
VKENPTQDEKKTEKVEAPKEVLSESRHEVSIGGVPLKYTATAGNLVLKDEEGKPKANICFVAYVKDEAGDVGRRPITFAFNGGPGSSSVWLHLGAFGPQRVEFPDEGDTPPPPPYRLVDNESSLLDLTDLVFIDPVTTGYSRAVPGDEAKKFHGVKDDIESVAEFIRLYTTRFKRWASPKFLAGESYGTTRAAGLAHHLQERHGMFLSGLVLVSCALSFQTLHFDALNDLPYVLFLPTYTATAFYHKKLAAPLLKNLERTLDESRAFAAEEYSVALLKGDDLPRAKRQQIITRLARYTGLSTRFIEQCDLRVGIDRFVKELLREDRRTVGRLDTRFVGYDRDTAGESFEFDPSYAAIQGPFTAMLNHLMRVELRYETDLPYEILTDRVHPWKYDEAENQYLEMSERLRKAMSRNASLRVFVGSGVYDLATPLFATEFTFRHLGLEPLGHRVTSCTYEAGHMMYIRKACREKLKADLSEWYSKALPAQDKP